MITKICWGLCDASFDMAYDDSISPFLRRFFEWRGLFWYWTALLLEGRAVECWKEA